MPASQEAVQLCCSCVQLCCLHTCTIVTELGDNAWTPDTACRRSLQEQLDLAVEATHLARFNKNFKTWRNLSFPAPVYPLVTENILVSLGQVLRWTQLASDQLRSHLRRPKCCYPGTACSVPDSAPA